MRRLDGLLLAFAQIRAQKLKSFFGVIGVLIGSMFLVTVVSIVEGMNTYMEEDFARQVFGLNTLTVRQRPSVQMNAGPDEWRALNRRPRLEIDDAEAIQARLTVPALVAVSSDSRRNVSAEDGTEVEGVQLTAASAEYFGIRQLDVERGRLFTSLEDRVGAPVAVLGFETAETLFGGRDPLGRWIRVEGQRYRVIGVLEEQGSLFGMSLDNRLVAPARSQLSRLTNPSPTYVDEILVRTAETEQMDRARLEIEAIMRQRHQLRPADGNDFEVETAEDSMSFWNRISQILYIAFPGLVAIALVVGGMVIMNIMLVSVAERTREIGLRKALGARRGDILSQILVESAVLSGSGAAVGIGIGIALAELVRALSPLPATIAPHWMALAALLGIGVGVLAGIYPANRAARMDPIAALRHE